MSRPSAERAGHRPIYDLAGHSQLTTPDNPTYPADLMEAADYILGSGLKEIAAYAGYPLVQASLALEIADQILTVGEDISLSLQKWQAGLVIQDNIDVVPLDLTDRI